MLFLDGKAVNISDRRSDIGLPAPGIGRARIRHSGIGVGAHWVIAWIASGVVFLATFFVFVSLILLGLTLCDLLATYWRFVRRSFPTHHK